MQTRIRTSTFTFEFEGSPEFFNEVIRPMVGGPKAPPDPEPQAAPPGGHAPARGSGPMPAAPVDYASAGYRLAEDTPEGRAPWHGGPGNGGPGNEGPGSEGPERGPRSYQGDRFRDDRPYRDSPGFSAPRPPRRPRPVAAELLTPEQRSSDPKTLYTSLSQLQGRRGEKDTVLAAVWFVSDGGQRDATADEVTRHLRENGVEVDIKVRPALKKHVTRTKMCEPGEAPSTVRLSPKGVRYVESRLLEA